MTELPTPCFYAILDTGYVSETDWRDKAKALLDGGAGILQVRAKGYSPESLLNLALQVHPLCEEYGVPLIINDQLEVALQIPKAGLHVGQDDLDPRVARSLLGPERILGLSTHSWQQAQQAIGLAEILNYFAVGPIFPTGTKPDYTAVGLDLLQQVALANPAIPFFAIGGINRGNAQQVRQAGAMHGFVSVSDPLLDADTRSATATLCAIANQE